MKAARAFALMSAVIASLAETPAWSTERPLWELGAGIGVLSLPHYLGSDQQHTYALPLPYFVYRGKILKADREGTRAVLFESDRLDFDVSGALMPPTRSDDNDARRGMADLKPTVELGPNMNFTLARGPAWKFDLRLPVHGVATLESNPRFIGWSTTPKLNLDLVNVADSGWNVGLVGAVSFATRNVHGRIYDVAPADALPDRPAYRTRGGYSGAHLRVSLSRRFESLWAGVYVRGDRIDGARYEASPLVRQRGNVFVGFAASWVFATSATMVDVPDLP